MKNVTHVFITAFIMIVLSHSNSIAALITANVLDSHIEVGEVFDVEIWADPGVASWELTSFGFDVDDSHDGILSYTSHTINPVLFDASDPSNPLNISGLGDPLSPSIGNVLLSTLSFTANQAGLGTFSLSGLYDGFWNGLFYLDQVAMLDPAADFLDIYPGADIYLTQEINVHTSGNVANPVPEPSTLLLCAVGLIGLVSYRRKQKV